MSNLNPGPSQTNNSRLLTSTRDSTTVIAAFNSLNQSGADIVCTGYGDEVLINQAIANVPAFGGRVLLRAGTYTLTNPIVIDRSWITLEGENHPMWGGFTGSWTGTATKVYPSDCATQIRQAGSGNGITIANLNIPDNGENRHRGICIRNLYIVNTANYPNNSTGISAAAGHDFCLLENNAISGFATGIFGNFDSAMILNNSLQYINGCALNMQTTNTRAIGNLIFDCAGNSVLGGFYIGGNGNIAAQNKLGDIAQLGIVVASYGSVVCGNAIGGCNSSAIYVNWSGNSITGNVIDFNTTTFGKTHRTQGAIYVNSGTDGAGNAYGANSITGNTILASSATSESANVYAIDGASTAGNYIEGNAIRGLWNNSGTAVNSALTGGTNVVGNNPTS